MPVIDPTFEDAHLKETDQYFSNNLEEMNKELHKYAKKLLDRKVQEAWQVLLMDY